MSGLDQYDELNSEQSRGTGMDGEIWDQAVDQEFIEAKTGDDTRVPRDDVRSVFSFSFFFFSFFSKNVNDLDLNSNLRERGRNFEVQATFNISCVCGWTAGDNRRHYPPSLSTPIDERNATNFDNSPHSTARSMCQRRDCASVHDLE